ncbi:hypothetical protein C453_12946 [Haloferax elongans ATCC BAA-1513]|uniref:Uncharacterized protein n=1 Tax=Haloferax elongans ATCC BAA-1513 TaxID=1230453 RepID=M0HMX4_HALEO|nr:hypothetical protein [Haloferax elongans]ELZ84454.1 hypothetical protein C453_12946 [Haloferax elongans ATCC BAA-1513]
MTNTTTTTTETDGAETITVTILIDGHEYIRQVEGTHWARDDSRTLYVYDGPQTVLEAADQHVVEVFREDRVDTVGMIDRSTELEHGQSDDEAPASTTTTRSD